MRSAKENQNKPASGESFSITKVVGGHRVISKYGGHYIV